MHPRNPSHWIYLFCRPGPRPGVFPERGNAAVILRDGRAAAVIRFGSSPPDPRPMSGARTSVTTSPPGARIEADGFFMGHSPLRLDWKVPAHGGRYFADGEHTITARLEAAPQSLQEARIPGGKFLFEGHDRIPPSVHFDLRTPPEAAR